MNVFFKQKTDKLSLHKKHDHFIESMKKKTSTRALLYRISKHKLKLIKTYFEKHFIKTIIVISLTFFASLILFANKSNDNLKFYVDFKKFHEITKKIVISFC